MLVYRPCLQATCGPLHDKTSQRAGSRPVMSAGGFMACQQSHSSLSESFGGSSFLSWRSVQPNARDMCTVYDRTSGSQMIEVYSLSTTHLHSVGSSGAWVRRQKQRTRYSLHLPFRPFSDCLNAKENDAWHQNMAVQGCCRQSSISTATRGRLSNELDGPLM